MNNKRKQPDSHSGGARYQKRSRVSYSDGGDDSPAAVQSRIDPTYGQRGAFPGLDDTTDGDELFYGPASDGLEYLRMVRSEAKTVPNLLVAPKAEKARLETHDLYDDYPQGYYADGAYTATPLPSSTTQLTQRDGKQEEDEDTQEAYYVSLCNRFAELTETLQSPAPSTAPNRTNVYNLDWRTRRVWRGKVLNTAPTMVILSQLSQESVVCGLGVLEAELTFRTLARGEGKKIGAWAWGLLGRCREVGQMGSEEVGVLRKLAKKAIWLLRRISAGEMFGGENDEPNMDDGEGIAEDVNDEEGQGGREDEAAGASDAEDSIGDFTPNIDPVSLAVLHHDGHTPSPPSTGNSEAAIAEAKKRVLNSMGAIDQTQDEFMGAELKNGAVLEPTTSIQPDRTTETGEREDPGDKVDVKASIFATLDMLVTIIGEFYGQKDLLGGRILWDEMQ